MMNRTWKQVGTYGLPLVVAAAALVSAKLWASDRGDAPSGTLDPASDIVDVYSFMSPVPRAGGPVPFLPSGRFVAAMTVRPNAATDATFATDVDYSFRIQSTPDGTAPDGTVNVLLSCRFAAPIAGAQDYFCNANGVVVAGTTGIVSSDAAAPLRVFAGRRKDPSNGPAALVANHTAGATAPANAYAGQSVLAIVAELNVGTVLFGGDPPEGRLPLFSVSAETSR